MEDSENVVEGLAPEQAPETTESPEVADKDESPAEEPSSEVDSDLAEFATNRGYSAEDLKDEKISKALKMAHDNQKALHTKAAPVEEPADNELDRFLDEMLGDNHTEADVQKTQEVLAEIDPEKLGPDERALLKHLEDRAEAKARAIIAPYEADLRKKQYKSDMESLVKEYGEDVIHQAPAILAKVKTGIPLREATQSVLLDGMLKKATSSGVEKGKQIKAQEITQQVEQTKKADAKLSLEDFNKLSSSEQLEIFKAAGLVK